MIFNIEHRYFFQQGIYFECQQCGVCCTGDPGIIRVTPTEQKQIASFLKIPLTQFIDEFLFPFENTMSIKERKSGACIFYENGCQIYPVRPLQCHTYPFWINLLRSEKMWKQNQKLCPGIGKGQKYSQDDILNILNQNKDYNNDTT